MADTRAAGLRLGALTNDMTDFHGADWVARQEHLKLFDVIIDAGLLGVLKPDPRAFGRAAGELGLPRNRSCSSMTCRGTSRARARWGCGRSGCHGTTRAGHRHRPGAARAAGQAAGFGQRQLREQACR